MLKPSLINILLFWFVKYIAFYVLLMFKSNNYTLIEVSQLKNGEDWFLYLWMFLFLPVVSMLIFTTPVYFSFKMKSVVYFALIVTAILIGEYFVYVFFTSDRHIDINGIYNGGMSLLFLLLFFYKSIKPVFK